MNTTINFQELRERISPDQIKHILGEYGVKPFYETGAYIIFPTCCHNLEGGSNKLYYYKNTRLFKCYTQCDDMFDIFELLQKMGRLRNMEYNIFDVISKCGLSLDTAISEADTIDLDIGFLYDLLNSRELKYENPLRDPAILNRYIFDKVPLQLWAKEGISFDTMQKYSILFDPIDECIVIPNYDENGKLVAVRGRFTSEDAEVKYKPLVMGGEVLSCPSSSILYGLNITKEAIRRNGIAFIFEGEKSVLKMDTIYGDRNCAIATLGKTISNQQIEMLMQLGVREVVLCYDADYYDYPTMVEKRMEYIKLASVLKPYFNVCILMDLNCKLLQYKDSPIDQGKEIFERLLKNRIYI